MVDEEIVVGKLRHINEYTDDLKQMRGMEKETYIADTVTQRAVERTFMNLIQSCIDLAQYIRPSENLAHRYGDVNHDVVYDVLHNDLHYFEQFQQEVVQWFQQRA